MTQQQKKTRDYALSRLSDEATFVTNLPHHDCVIQSKADNPPTMNHNYRNHACVVLTQALRTGTNIKAICRPQQPFLDASRAQLSSKLLSCRVKKENKNRNSFSSSKTKRDSDRNQNKNSLSIRKDTSKSTPHSVIEMQSKRGSFLNLSFTMTVEYILAGPGSRLIPVALLGRMSKHDSSNATKASLSANSPSQSPSFHLSLPIVIITGDYRQFSYPLKTTLVSLLGYNSCLLYTSPSPRD